MAGAAQGIGRVPGRRQRLDTAFGLILRDGQGRTAGVENGKEDHPRTGEAKVFHGEGLAFVPPDHARTVAIGTGLLYGYGHGGGLAAVPNPAVEGRDQRHACQVMTGRFLTIVAAGQERRSVPFGSPVPDRSPN